MEVPASHVATLAGLMFGDADATVAIAGRCLQAHAGGRTTQTSIAVRDARVHPGAASEAASLCVEEGGETGNFVLRAGGDIVAKAPAVTLVAERACTSAVIGGSRAHTVRVWFSRAEGGGVTKAEGLVVVSTTSDGYHLRAVPGLCSVTGCDAPRVFVARALPFCEPGDDAPHALDPSLADTAPLLRVVTEVAGAGGFLAAASRVECAFVAGGNKDTDDKFQSACSVDDARNHVEWVHVRVTRFELVDGVYEAYLANRPGVYQTADSGGVVRAHTVSIDHGPSGPPRVGDEHPSAVVTIKGEAMTAITKLHFYTDGTVAASDEDDTRAFAVGESRFRRRPNMHACVVGAAGDTTFLHGAFVFAAAGKKSSVAQPQQPQPPQTPVQAAVDEMGARMSNLARLAEKYAGAELSPAPSVTTTTSTTTQPQPQPQQPRPAAYYTGGVATTEREMRERVCGVFEGVGAVPVYVYVRFRDCGGDGAFGSLVAWGSGGTTSFQPSRVTDEPRVWATPAEFADAVEAIQTFGAARTDTPKEIDARAERRGTPPAYPTYVFNEGTGRELTNPGAFFHGDDAANTAPFEAVTYAFASEAAREAFLDLARTPRDHLAGTRAYVDMEFGTLRPCGDSVHSGAKRVRGTVTGLRFQDAGNTRFGFETLVDAPFSTSAAGVQHGMRPSALTGPGKPGRPAFNTVAGVHGRIVVSGKQPLGSVSGPGDAFARYHADRDAEIAALVSASAVGGSLPASHSQAVLDMYRPEPAAGGADEEETLARRTVVFVREVRVLAGGEPVPAQPVDFTRCVFDLKCEVAEARLRVARGEPAYPLGPVAEVAVVEKGAKKPRAQKRKAAAAAKLDGARVVAAAAKLLRVSE